jgi:hypothetical protein
MRLLVSSGLYPNYRPRLDHLAANATTFADRTAAFLADRFGAAHFLKPVLDGSPEVMFVNADDMTAQKMWARENRLPATADPATILRAQIEAHRTEVFYNLDPISFDGDFAGRLPASVRRSIAWRAAPIPKGVSLWGYDLILNNFPTILQGYRETGLRAEYFAPAHDPVMDGYREADRPVDVVFVGGFSRHHKKRTEFLTEIAGLAERRQVRMHLDRSRLTKLASTPLGLAGPLRNHRMPAAIQSVAAAPLFGLDLYKALSRAKIVVNGAIDMAGPDRGNMRCWEGMGLGCALVSDAGKYPDGMVDGETLRLYKSPAEAVGLVEDLLAAPEALAALAARGREMIRSRYSKERQWTAFQELAA